MAKITVRNQVSGHTQVIDRDDWNNKWSKDLKRRYEIIAEEPEKTIEVQQSSPAEEYRG